MKKLLCSVIVAVVLVGCGSGSGETKAVKKTCTIDQSGVEGKIIATAPSEDSDVETVKMEASVSYKTMSIEKDEVTDEMKDYLINMMETSVLASMDLDKEDIKMESEFNDDGLMMEITFDVDQIKKVMGTEDADTSMKSFLKSMKSNGYSCK